MGERREKKARVNTSRTRMTKQKAMEEYSKINKEVKKSVIADKEAFPAEIAEKADRAATVGQMTKTLVGKRSKADIPVKSRDGKTISDQEEQVQRWAEYFQELLNRPQPDHPPEILPARRDLPIMCDQPSGEEIRKSIRQLNSGKAAGPDRILERHSKQIKTRHAVVVLESIFYKIWMEEKYLDDWKEGHIVKIPKKET